MGRMVMFSVFKIGLVRTFYPVNMQAEQFNINDSFLVLKVIKPLTAQRLLMKLRWGSWTPLLLFSYDI